jgi:ligand-binding sensor domain-containing protein
MSTEFRTRRHATIMVFFLLLPLLFGSRSCIALNPKVAISQYSHTSWRVQDGAFEGTPTSIAQTTDGYLWIGTSSGLFRFDGVRFVRVDFDIPGYKQQAHAIYSLLGVRDGSLWVSIAGALIQLKEGQWQRTLLKLGFASDMIETPSGVVWVAFEHNNSKIGGFCAVTSLGLNCEGKEQGINTSTALAFLKDGSLAVGASGGLFEWKDRIGTLYAPKGIGPAANLESITAILPEADGSLWVGMPMAGPGLGLQRLSLQKSWSALISSSFDSSKISVASLHEDREKSVWVGTRGQGIYRIHDAQVSHYGRAEGLTSNSVEQSFEDHEGNLWFVTAMGLDRFRDFPVVTYSDAEGLEGADVGAVLAARDGTIWISNGVGLNFIRDGKMHLLGRSDGLPGDRVTSMLQDYRGRIWVGVDDKLAIYDKGHFQLVNRKDGSPIGAVEMMTEDNEHAIWIKVVADKPSVLVRVDADLTPQNVTISGLSGVRVLQADPRGGIWIVGVKEGFLHYQDGKVVPLVQPAPAKPIETETVLAEADGTIWASTKAGLMHWQNGHFTTLTIANGLPCERATAILKSLKGSIWLYSFCGVVEITREQIEQWLHNPAVHLNLRALGVEDGALPHFADFMPAASESPDGRLWFASNTVLQVVDSSHLQTNTLPPPVHIEQLVADRKSYPSGQPLLLPKLTGDLQIDYVALSLVSSERVRFKYKLDGFDPDWQWSARHFLNQYL